MSRLYRDEHWIEDAGDLAAKRIGVPYGPAVIEDGRYGVRCPECGKVFHADPHDEAATRRDWEDDETKGAGRAYAAHYQEVHE